MGAELSGDKHDRKRSNGRRSWRMRRGEWKEDRIYY